MASQPMNFISIPATGKKLSSKQKSMKNLTDSAADELRAGLSTCGYNIVASATLGGIFGGAGALIGAVAAATGPSCLAWW